MKGITLVKSYIKWVKGKIKCHCPVDDPKCDDYKKCDIDYLEHDKYKGWQKCFKQDKYGK